jgi:hypothetical protein
MFRLISVFRASKITHRLVTITFQQSAQLIPAPDNPTGDAEKGVLVIR